MKRVGYFGADYCKACHEKRPLVEQTCRELGVMFVYLDVKDPANNLLMSIYDVRSIPTVVVTELPDSPEAKTLYRATGGLINRPALERVLRAEADSG